MNLVEGSVSVNGSIAYVAQQVQGEIDRDFSAVTTFIQDRMNSELYANNISIILPVICAQIYASCM